MGQGCAKRKTPISDFTQTLTAKLKGSRFKRSPTYFLDREWHIVLTPTQKFQAVVRRIIALLRIRRKTAYYFNHLNELTKLSNNGYPSSQTLFKELERKSGSLERKTFARWNDASNSWTTIGRPPAINEPWNFTTHPRPGGRKLVNPARPIPDGELSRSRTVFRTPPNATVPRSKPRTVTARPKQEPRDSHQ
jgi:hypothetical protein